MRDKKLTGDVAKKLLKSNLEEVGKLRSLTDSLLNLDNQEAAQPDSPVDLRDLATAATKRLAKAAELKSIVIESEVKSCLVKGDEKSLTELVAILLDNAVKYSPPKSTIAIRGGRKGKGGFLAVVDSGSGIVPSELPQIFNRFYRADPSRNKAKAEGYGLGLSIAKKIVDTHHGHIEVKSSVGSGSTFTIFLPGA